MPSWYLLIRAAKYLGVPPWELAKMPIFWRDAALAAESAENYAENEKIKRIREK